MAGRYNDVTKLKFTSITSTLRYFVGKLQLSTVLARDVLAIVQDLKIDQWLCQIFIIQININIAYI